jgi:hypothetical protein
LEAVTAVTRTCNEAVVKTADVLDSNSASPAEALGAATIVWKPCGDDVTGLESSVRAALLLAVSSTVDADDASVALLRLAETVENPLTVVEVTAAEVAAEAT